MKTILLTLLSALSIANFTFGAESETASSLSTPVKLEADGTVLDVGMDTGYAGPLVTDYDKDGKPDLIVTSISGKFRWYRNVSEGAEPIYQHKGLIEANGAPLKLKNW